MTLPNPASDTSPRHTQAGHLPSPPRGQFGLTLPLDVGESHRCIDARVAEPLLQVGELWLHEQFVLDLQVIA